jgi:hypothetical protein
LNTFLHLPSLFLQTFLGSPQVLFEGGVKYTSYICWWRMDPMWIHPSCLDGNNHIHNI